MKDDEFLDNKLVLDICWKRKKSDEKEEEVVEKDKDRFKTPTRPRPENRIPEVRECPPAPRKGGKKYSMMRIGKTISCRRQLSFPPEYTVSSFAADLQWTIIKRDR
ncbi:hypothetical protein N665_0520s0019 [Sinapis alba]|nr:hypothetical protein N665_0520s0019 [Sinapis alba]